MLALRSFEDNLEICLISKIFVQLAGKNRLISGNVFFRPAACGLTKVCTVASTIQQWHRWSSFPISGVLASEQPAPTALWRGTHPLQQKQWLSTSPRSQARNVPKRSHSDGLEGPATVSKPFRLITSINTQIWVNLDPGPLPQGRHIDHFATTSTIPKRSLDERS